MITSKHCHAHHHNWCCPKLSGQTSGPGLPHTLHAFYSSTTSTRWWNVTLGLCTYRTTGDWFWLPMGWACMIVSLSHSHWRVANQAICSIDSMDTKVMQSLTHGLLYYSFHKSHPQQLQGLCMLFVWFRVVLSSRRYLLVVYVDHFYFVIVPYGFFFLDSTKYSPIEPLHSFTSLESAVKRSYHLGVGRRSLLEQPLIKGTYVLWWLQVIHPIRECALVRMCVHMRVSNYYFKSDVIRIAFPLREIVRGVSSVIDSDYQWQRQWFPWAIDIGDSIDVLDYLSTSCQLHGHLFYVWHMAS